MKRVVAVLGIVAALWVNGVAADFAWDHAQPVAAPMNLVWDGGAAA